MSLITLFTNTQPLDTCIDTCNEIASKVVVHQRLPQENIKPSLNLGNNGTVE